MSDKLSPQHLERQAVVYVRQSTFYQVHHNLESKRRQYALADRATRLARQALTALPDSTGYVGVDLVLGGDPLGGDDHVIEVNPRLTTSYVGLRQLVQGNLADAMLRIAGGTATPVSCYERTIEFRADGQL